PPARVPHGAARTGCARPPERRRSGQRLHRRNGGAARARVPGSRAPPAGGECRYGRGNNQAMRRALDSGAEFVALINNDVAVSPDWLRRLLEAAAAHPEAGLFTGTLLFRGEEVVNSTGLVIDAFGRARDRDFRVPVADR